MTASEGELSAVREGNVESGGRFRHIAGVPIPVPSWLTPGKTYPCHRNDHSAPFDIRIAIRHALFGTTCTQAGVFREVRP